MLGFPEISLKITTIAIFFFVIVGGGYTNVQRFDPEKEEFEDIPDLTVMKLYHIFS